MKKKIEDWSRRHPRKGAIVLNLAAVGTTILFTVIALGPGSLLEECSSD